MGRGVFFFLFFFLSILRLLVSGYIRGLFVLPHAGLAEHIQTVPKEDKKGLLLVVMEWSIMEYQSLNLQFQSNQSETVNRTDGVRARQNSIAGHSPLGKGPVSGKRRSGQVAGIESMEPMGHTGAGGGAAACVMQVVGVNLDQQSPLTMRTHCIYRVRRI